MHRSRAPADDYGDRYPRLWAAGLGDRLRGAHARANARWGYLHAPQGRGRLIWVKAGASRASVRLGAELLGAMHERRRDVRLVLTFEAEHPDVIERHLVGLRRVGVGYGPCDAPHGARRALARLDPYALVLVDAPPRHNLPAMAQQRGLHVAAYNTPVPLETGRIEACYPVSEEDAARWRALGTAQYVAPAADAQCLFTEAQADTTLRSLAGGPRALDLWWVHGAAGAFTAELCRRWSRSPLATAGVLFISQESPATHPDDLDLPPSISALDISGWRRTPLAPATWVRVDDPRWLPALSAACTAAHLERADRPVLWQALAGGSPLSVARSMYNRFTELRELQDSLQVLESPEAVLRGWEHCLAAPSEARRRGDAGRRLFWEQRRRAGAVLGEFLQRVFDW